MSKVPVSEFSTYYDQAMKKGLPELQPHPRRLRVSGLPYCGLKDAYLKMTNHVEPDSDAGMSYYCGVGTAAHEVFQRWLGTHGRIYGDWKCRNRKCRHVEHFSRKHRCPKCGHEMKYEEFTVKAFKHLSGHTDGLFRSKDRRFWLIDYKTCSVRIIETQHKHGMLPYRKNVHQISAYVPLLERKLRIEIAGWMLIYIARDNPWCFTVLGETMSDAEKDATWQKLRRYDRQFDVVGNLETFEQVQWLAKHKLCKSHEHYIDEIKGHQGCPLAPVCFSRQLQPTLEFAFAEFEETVKTENLSLLKV